MNTIRRYGNPAEAAFARSLLVAAGIEAVLADEFASALGPQFVPWGVRLQVPEEDVERAIGILDGEIGVEGGPPEEDVPMEHEVGWTPPVETKSSEITCPGCGVEWALTEQESGQPSFTCTDCATVIPLKQEGPLPISGNSVLRAFLPRSDSKWVFILVMVAYNHFLQLILIHVMAPLVGAGAPTKAHGWSELTIHLGDSLLISPIWQTLALVGIIEVFRAVRTPTTVQIIIPAILVCSTDGLTWWPHAVYSFPGFAIFGLSYLYWRPVSGSVAAAIAIAIHAMFNATVDIRLVSSTFESERVSGHLTGDASSWERADGIYRGHWDLHQGTENEENIEALRSAIAIYPYDPEYYLSLGLDYRHAGSLAEAEATLRKAVALNDHESLWKAWYDLSFVLNDEKRFRDALDAAHQALLIAPVDKQSEIEAQIASIAPKANGNRR